MLRQMCPSKMPIGWRSGLSSRFATTAVTLQDIVRDSLGRSFEGQLTRSDHKLLDPMISVSKSGSPGDYQSNIALLTCKQLGMDPKTVAAEIVRCIAPSGVVDAERTSVSGAGFINFCLSKDHLSDKMRRMMDDKHRAFDMVDAKSQTKRIVVDYSSPNIAKEMHVVSKRLFE